MNRTERPEKGIARQDDDDDPSTDDSKAVPVVAEQSGASTIPEKSVDRSHGDRTLSAVATDQNPGSLGGQKVVQAGSQLTDFRTIGDAVASEVPGVEFVGSDAAFLGNGESSQGVVVDDVVEGAVIDTQSLVVSPESGGQSELGALADGRADGAGESKVTVAGVASHLLADQKLAQVASNPANSQATSDTIEGEARVAEAGGGGGDAAFNNGLPEGIVENDVVESASVVSRPIAATRDRELQSELGEADDLESDADRLGRSKQSPLSVGEVGSDLTEFESPSEGRSDASGAHRGAGSQLKRESGLQPDGGALDRLATIETGPVARSSTTVAMGEWSSAMGIGNPSTVGQASGVGPHVVQVSLAEMVDRIPELVSAEVSSLDDGQTSELRIQVEPADMGTVDIQVRMAADRVHAQIVTSEMTTSELLSRDRQHLVQALQDMGLDVSQFDISHRQDSSEFRDSRQGSRQFGGGAAASGSVESPISEGKSPLARSSNVIDVIA